MTLSPPLRIGTRGSALARAQTTWVARQLQALGHEVAIELIGTIGDARHDLPIAGLGGDGVFVRELERALLERRIDVAVHSLKDLPTAETPGLVIAGVPGRASPFDVLVTADGGSLAGLRPGAVVATSSVRRTLQLRMVRPDLEIRPLRGNVDTRLARLAAGDCDALVLAGAGLERLGQADRISEVLRPPAFWPAVGQGALAVQIRADDPRAAEAVVPLDDPVAHTAVRAERSCLAALAGGCLAPIGGWARLDERGWFVLGATVLEDSDGTPRRIFAETATELSGEKPGTGALADSTGPTAKSLGFDVASRLESLGASAMLARVRAHAQGG
jgi:hydroxymethylbilane synthase